MSRARSMISPYPAVDRPGSSANAKASLLRNDGSLILPTPRVSGGKALLQTLKERRTHREFSRERLPMQLLSDLLWAAFGINRRSTRGRTAPSAEGCQEIDIFVALHEGVYVFDALRHALMFRQKEDVRARTGMQDFVAEAPLELVYVADFARMHDASDADKLMYSAADAGFIGQNVYLFCASEGLATVVRGLVDRLPLSRVLELRPEQRIVLAQTVGFPPNSA